MKTGPLEGAFAPWFAGSPKDGAGVLVFAAAGVLAEPAPNANEGVFAWEGAAVVVPGVSALPPGRRFFLLDSPPSAGADCPKTKAGVV